jgi:ATP-dependent DNA helicase RecG
MAEHLQREIFPEYRVGLIHGRMPDRDKERIMAEFLGDALDILVSTTVIEVGIEVPQASLMIIEHAERFGLSQLHQLRGRVGRSDIPSQCILMAGSEISRDALKRIHLMEKTNDGFQIAEMDLALRGPGEFMGTRQTGLPDFRVTDMVQDIGILQEAREDAFSLAESDPGLGKKKHAGLKRVLERRWAERMDLVKTG